MSDNFLDHFFTIFVCTNLLVDMRKQITIGIGTMTSRRGDLFPPKTGKQRQTRANCYGILIDSAGGYLWGITWGNGQSTREMSTRLCIDRRQPVDIPCCHCLLKTNHYRKPQGMFTNIILTTGPELPVLLYLRRQRRGSRIHWHGTTTIVREKTRGRQFRGTTRSRPQYRHISP